MDSTYVKENELFDMLQNQYMDRLNIIKTQQNLLNKQTSIINNKDTYIKEQKDIINNTTDKVNTRKRMLVYDEKDDNLNRFFIISLKLLVFIMAIVIATLIYINTKQ